VSDGRDDIVARWYIAEDAGKCARWSGCCCPGAKATTWRVHDGSDATGRVIMTHEKGTTCSHCPAIFGMGGEMIRIPCCCCLSYLETKDQHGNTLGTTKYICDMFLCVPKFDVFDANDQRMFRVRSETCCFGCCTVCNCGQHQGGRGHGRFRIPHQIRHPEAPFEAIAEADITDLWARLMRQCCTKQELLGVKFPTAMSLQHGQDIQKAKAILVGTALLLNTLMYDLE